MKRPVIFPQVFKRIEIMSKHIAPKPDPNSPEAVIIANYMQTCLRQDELFRLGIVGITLKPYALQPETKVLPRLAINVELETTHPEIKIEPAKLLSQRLDLLIKFAWLAMSTANSPIAVHENFQAIKGRLEAEKKRAVFKGLQIWTFQTYPFALGRNETQTDIDKGNRPVTLQLRLLPPSVTLSLL